VAASLLAKLTGKGPAPEQIPPGGLWIPLGPCDATASGAEDAQVCLSRGRAEELALCAHHFCELEFILAIAGWRVTRDYRGLL
jgi:hypothetical protein